VALIAAAGVLLAVHTITPFGVLGQLTYLAFTAGGAAIALAASRRLTGAAARPWRWVAYGLACSAVADAYWAVHLLAAPPVPYVTVADVPWILSYAFLIAALFALLRDVGDGVRDDLEGLIDTLTALVVGVLVLWELIVAPVLQDTTTELHVRLVWASYPVLDSILLALVLRAVFGRRATSAVGRLFAVGVALWLFSDIGTNLATGDGLIWQALDAGWMLGAAFMGVATWVAAQHHGQPTLDRATRPAVPGRIGPWRVAVAVSPLLVPVIVEMWSDRVGYDAPILLATGTAALTLLVGARMLLFLRTRDEAERRLVASERHYMALAANSADAVLLIDEGGRIINESPHLAALVGQPGESIRGVEALTAVCAEDAPNAADLFMRAMSAPGKVFDSELRVRTTSGPGPWLAVRAVNLLHDNDVRGIVVNFHDITLRKQAEAELVRLAFHDSLTGLANRALFHDRVEHVIDSRGISDAAVLFLDLDDFKHVNDGLGHDAGDDLLREVASRLRHAARPGDTVARLGGDEFAVLLERCPDPIGSARHVADRILSALTEPVLLSDGLITVSASIGIATPDHDATVSSVLRDADIAMYEAKAAGRGRWVLYTSSMRAATVERLQIDQDLSEALEREQLRIVYQPVVELSTGAIAGFEALLRWNHPVLGLIGPERFIPLAERSGLIIPIGRWVLEQACATAATWQLENGRRDLTMAVNVSARQLASSDLVSHVEDALADSGLDAGSLILEMTETVLVDDPEAAAGRLRQLRRLGVRLAVDDFGTGYSSLSYLRQYPVDILKVDKSFIASITETELPALVHGLIELGHTLQLELVAEGIETPAQLAHLQMERCRLGQGYLFSRAVDEAEASALLRRGTFPFAAQLGAPSYAVAAS
jgi:diguanylate cyclase (GGDEF)-like protein/PAS domain S-box-containing protein